MKVKVKGRPNVAMLRSFSLLFCFALHIVRLRGIVNRVELHVALVLDIFVILLLHLLFSSFSMTSSHDWGWRQQWGFVRPKEECYRLGLFRQFASSIVRYAQCSEVSSAERCLLL